MGNSVKIRKSVDKQEFAAFLRDMAEALEQGGKDELACLDDFQKVQVSFKQEYDQIQLKAKIRPAGVCDEESPEGEEGGETPGKPKYKHLKKRMKGSFRLLVKMIHDGEMPPAEAVESFLEDSALMVTYPGYGDEFYDRYTSACEAFRAAYAAGDMDRMHETIDVLVHEKSRCHAKYD